MVISYYSEPCKLVLNSCDYKWVLGKNKNKWRRNMLL